MTNLLLRLFIRDLSCNDPKAHAAIGKLAGITGIVCNLLLASVKLIVGFLMSSIAIAGDGVNNLMDSASSVVTLLGFRMAQRPADREHPFGHGRYEYVSGLVVAALVLLAGTELVKSSVKKIFRPEDMAFSLVSVGILALSILAKLWMAGFNRKLGRMLHSRTLEATAQDSRNDVIATSAVLLSVLAEALFAIHLDGIIGLGVAIFILWSGILLARDTVSPLLGMQADETLVRELTDLVLTHQRVLGIHDLLIHDYGPGRCFATVHAEMDAGENPLEAHDQLDHIEQEALCRLGVHLVIHYDPVASKEWETYHTMAAQCAARIAEGLTIHDLRVVNYQEQPKLTFDLAVPFNLQLPDETIVQRLKEGLESRGCKLPMEIHIDRRE